MIVIKSVSEIKENDFDEIWAIVRFPKKMESIKSKIIVPDLAPTSDLFGIYKELDNRGEWNSATFEDIYVPRFLKDIKKTKKLAGCSVNFAKMNGMSIKKSLLSAIVLKIENADVTVASLPDYCRE